MKHLLWFLILALFSCTNSDSTIKIKGSDTEVNLAVILVEQFRKENKEVLISVSGGGSGLGIASLLNGNADIANSSRCMKIEETQLFHKKKIALDSFVFAQDAIAFVVNVRLGLDSLSTNAIAKILNGEITNWATLLKNNIPITIYGRQSNSGTYDYIKSILKIHFSPYAKQMNGNAQILEALKADASGIGYVSAGYLLNGNAAGLKILNI
jgi:phosphate transport system substrate-binding protein